MFVLRLTPLEPGWQPESQEASFHERLPRDQHRTGAGIGGRTEVTYKEIAGELGITTSTVATHVRRFHEKLHVRSRRNLNGLGGQARLPATQARPWSWVGYGRWLRHRQPFPIVGQFAMAANSAFW